MLTVDEAIEIVQNRASALVDSLDGKDVPGPGQPARVTGTADAVRPLLIGCDLDVDRVLARLLTASENSLVSALGFTLVVMATPEQWQQMIYTLNGAMVQQLLLGYLLGESAGREAACPDRG